MAAGLAVTAPTPNTNLRSWTISITGATATTDYVVEITGPTGHIQKRRVTTDGTGAGTATYVPQASGSFTAVLRPYAAYNGTTTAEATLTATTVVKFN